MPEATRKHRGGRGSQPGGGGGLDESPSSGAWHVVGGHRDVIPPDRWIGLDAAAPASAPDGLVS